MTDEVACHLFLTVLQSTAREWFTNLPPNGITCFADLREKFLMQYQNLCRHTYAHLYAHEIPMYRGEEIESFITRYMLECQKIPGLPETLQIFRFITCLDKDTHPSLVSELRWNIPSTFADAATVARQYQHSGRERQAGYHRDEKKREEERRSDSRHRHDSSRRSESHHKGHNSHGKSHDSHRTRKGKVFPSGTTEKRDGQKSDKYCEFHEDNGHDTNECKALIHEIIAKIKAGELNHLLSGRKFKKADPNKTFIWQKEDGKKREKAKDKVVINMISIEKDEIDPWRDTAITFPRLPKRYAREEPVMIDGLIDGFRVQEMYTDTGSEVDVLYAHCLSQLPKYVGRKMRYSNAIISGSAGSTEEPIGKLKATVMVGTKPYLRSEVIDFYVVKSVTATNVILGRNFFRKFNAITSTAHGLLKFPTRKGVATVESTRQPFLVSGNTQDTRRTPESKTPHILEEKRVLVLKWLSYFPPASYSNRKSPTNSYKTKMGVLAGAISRDGKNNLSITMEQLNTLVRHQNFPGQKVLKAPIEMERPLRETKVARCYTDI
ncbi:uncharacterized protein [Rutidosis leptorrhynchoides]|uniref:uncharacterized protein n=1 Tax=Rutidosis leptorrhynchoides TaxID=125765 RepID=UPI003A997806